MKSAIVEKLRTHLEGSLGTECQAVYLLCEVRKLLDKDKDQYADKFFALRLYCNWAVHVDLDIPRTTERFLASVDEYVLEMLNGDEIKETWEKERAIMKEFVFLDTLRGELAEFLGMHSLPTSLCDEEWRWLTFLKAYAAVIEDGSLACQAKAGTKLKFVERVTFSKSARKPDGGPLPFLMNWDVLLKDSRRVEIEVGALDHDGHMHWSFHLRPA